MMRTFLSSIVLMSAAGAAFAAPSALPDALIFNGKPVAPFCIARLTGLTGGKQQTVDLTKCKTSNKVVPMGEDKKSKGYIEHVSDTEYGQMVREMFAYYKYIGEANGLSVLRVNVNSGGSGEFSSVLQVKREGDVLTVMHQSDIGDRCNGGIAEVEIQDDDIIVEHRITPADFATIAGEPSKAKAYEDLEASAASCFAVARFSGTTLLTVVPSTDRLKQLAEPSKDDLEWTGKYKYQACFNKQFVKAAEDKSVWTPDNLKAFVKEFNSECAEAK